MLDRVLQLIAQQQAGEKPDSPAWCVGEDIKELARRLPAHELEILAGDLAAGMGIREAEKKAIHAYATAHGGCVPARKVPVLLCQYYGIQPPDDRPEATRPAAPAPVFDLNLEDLL